jgi:cell wall-associated NlpC family hydrolase
VTRPTPAALAFARSSLPIRRVASTSFAPAKPAFASLLNTAAAKNSAAQTTFAKGQSTLPRSSKAPPTYHAAMLPTAGGPPPISRSDILATAQQLLNVPYVWGGTSATGLDCSAFVSKAWGIGRQTTDTLASVSQPITKDELQAGDALNLTTGKDPEGDGHVRLFDRWANPEHTRMYVYEETPPRSIHHIINWDPKYTPMRRNDVIDA